MCRFSGNVEETFLGRDNSEPGPNDSSGPRADSVANKLPRWRVPSEWFIRACSVVTLAFWALSATYIGWPKDADFFGRQTGLVNGITLFVVSFTFVTTGRTWVVSVLASVVLAMFVIFFAAANLVCRLL